MKNNFLETLLGFLVLAIAFWFFIFAYNNSNIKQIKNTYQLTANFDNVEGINQGSDVMIAGVKIGQVHSIYLDPKDYAARVVLQINKDIKLPKDSSAAIVSSGFLGGKFVTINTGSDNETLNAGDMINYTHSSLNLESLIGKFLYSIGNNNSNK